MKKRVYKYYVADFETTTDNANEVAVWSANMIQIGKSIKCIHENCMHDTNMDEYINRVSNMSRYDNLIIYFHNLKFDGSYILDYLERSEKWKQYGEDTLDDRKYGTKYMHDFMYTYTVTDMNVFYQITLKVYGHFVEIRDSLKLLPFSLAEIASGFNTEHKKLEMDYSHKQPGYIPTNEEMRYIDNDVFVLKEGLEKFLEITGRTVIDGFPMTIGSECFSEYKNIFEVEHLEKFREFYPLQIKQCAILENCTFEDYIRRSYKGGWCYVSDRVKGVVLQGMGYVYDVNSLYPSVMHSKSKSFYPYGRGYYKAGDLDRSEQEFYKQHSLYYFLHVACEFNIKPGYLPTIQVKGDARYKSTEWLKTSDIVNCKTGEKIPCKLDLYLTCVDWELMQEHYIIKNSQIVSHISYCAQSGDFDSYIDKWYEIKQANRGAKRTLAKLMLNNLYGKFGQSQDQSYNIYHVENDILHSERVEYEDEKRIKYIPVASAITSWARNFTIRHAQENYNCFCYADTDSLHMIGDYRNAKGIVEHPTALCAWKCESTWNRAIFTGQKRYIEHVVEEDHRKCEEYDNIKCCGMSKGAKEYLAGMLYAKRYASFGMVVDDFDYSYFKPGLSVPGNLRGKRVKGGIFLLEQPFILREA